MLHRVAPQVKIAAAFGFVVAVVTTPREAIWAFLVYFAVLAVLVRLAGVRPQFVVRRLVVEVPFVIVALLLPVFGSGERVDIAALSLSVSGLWDMWNILAKATLGLITAVLLGATTQIPDMLKGLDALRVPALVTAIAGFMVRYVDVIMSDLGRMQVAMRSRAFAPRGVGQWRPYAATLGTMFVRTYERGERVALAMASRGYTGTMPAASRATAPGAQWIAAAAFVAGAWVLAIAAWGLR